MVILKLFNSKKTAIARLLNPLWALTSKFITPKKCRADAEINNILVVDLHLIGDIVLLIPLLDALKAAYINSSITLLCGGWAKTILIQNNSVSHYIEFEAPWVKPTGIRGWYKYFLLLFKLRLTRWDLAIDVRGDVRNILLLAFSGAAKRVGFDFTGGASLLTDVVCDDYGLSHLANHHQRIAMHLGVWQDNKPYVPRLKLSTEELLKSQSVQAYVGVHLGASNELRMLPISEAILLIRHCIYKYGIVVLFDFPGFCYHFDQLFDLLRPEELRSVVLWSGTLREFIVQLKAAKKLYVMDSGPAHIAAALGVDVTVIFGPNLPNYVKPLGSNVSLIERNGLYCRPCDQVKCVNSIHKCCLRDLNFK